MIKSKNARKLMVSIVVTMVIALCFIKDNAYDVYAADGEYKEFCQHEYVQSGDKRYIDGKEVSIKEYEATLSCGLTYEEFISGGTKVSSPDDLKKHLAADIHSLKTSLTYYLTGSKNDSYYNSLIDTQNDDGTADYTNFYITKYSYTSSTRDGLVRVQL